MGRTKPKIEAPQSKLTEKNQVAVPTEVREKLGIRPGSTVEWVERDGEIVVRRKGKYTFEDIHRAAFGNRKVTPRTVEEMDEAIGAYLTEKHRHGRR